MDIAAYDVVDNAVNDARYSEASNLTPPPKLLRQIPSIFCRGYHRDDPQNAENFAKIWRLVSEKFFEIKIILFWAPLYRGPDPDAKILFLSAWKPPSVQKISSHPQTSPFGDMGVKVSTFPPLPQILSGQIPSIFCIGYTRDDLQKPWKFCASLANSFRDIRLFNVRAYRRDTIVSSTLKAEYYTPTNTPSQRFIQGAMTSNIQLNTGLLYCDEIMRIQQNLRDCYRDWCYWCGIPVKTETYVANMGTCSHRQGGHSPLPSPRWKSCKAFWYNSNCSKTLSRQTIYALFSKDLSPVGLLYGPCWGTEAPDPLVWTPWKKSCGRPWLSTLTAMEKLYGIPAGVELYLCSMVHLRQ